MGPKMDPDPDRRRRMGPDMGSDQKMCKGSEVERNMSLDLNPQGEPGKGPATGLVPNPYRGPKMGRDLGPGSNPGRG
jgi:hypothetical protein